MEDTLFTNIADAIRARFSLSGIITPLQFGNKINSNTPVLSLNRDISFDVAMAMILENTGDAIRARGGTSGKIEPNDMPTAIRNIKIVEYGSLTTASQSNVAWTDVPSVPSVSLSQSSYTLYFEYYWSHSSYDSYKVNSVTITAGDSTIMNPAYSSNIKSRPFGDSTYDSLVIRCGYSKTVSFSELIQNGASYGMSEDEILEEMRAELQSEINNVKDKTFSFSISYYPGTYV